MWQAGKTRPNIQISGISEKRIEITSLKKVREMIQNVILDIKGVVNLHFLKGTSYFRKENWKN